LTDEKLYASVRLVMTRFDDILPDQDFAMKMRFSRRDVAAFFQPGPQYRSVTEERRMWIESDPRRHVAILPDGESVLDEVAALAISMSAPPCGLVEGSFKGLPPFERCRLLGESWEADFLLMRPDAEGVFRMVGGCLCFPSHWDLREKLGQPMAAIHAPVPGLNESLGRQIDGFLRRIKPGVSWERENWGLSRTPELNLHPSRGLPRLDARVEIDDVWFRIEEQSLVAMPQSGGVLFGIRLVVVPLSEILTQPTARRGMIRALRTMPEPVARYKGIAPARARLLELLEVE